MPTLRDLIAEGIHNQQHFIVTIDSQVDVAKILCAFANTKGGRLLIGVKNSGKVVGCNPAEEILSLNLILKEYCHPEFHFTSNILQDDFRLVLEIIITEAIQKPIKTKGINGKMNAFIRVKDQVELATKIVEGVWKLNMSSSVKQEHFDEEEKILLNCIKENQPISLSKLYRISDLPLSKVDRSLIMLIHKNIVEALFEKEVIYYIFKENTNTID